MLEEGKIYIVKTISGSTWLFKKCTKEFGDKICGRSDSLCIDTMCCLYGSGYVCCDNEVVYVKPANENYIAMWNRVFNDNVVLK